MGKLKSGFARLSDAQTILGIKQTWTTLAAGVSAVLTTVKPMAWHWKVLFFLGVMALILAIIHIVYATVWHERIVKTRAVRKLLRDAAERLALKAAEESLGNAREAAEKVIFMAHCDVLLLFALKPTVLHAYDYSIGVQKDRAKQRRAEFDPMPAKAAYLRDLSQRLSFDMIDPGFYPPESLDEFLKADIVWT